MSALNMSDGISDLRARAATRASAPPRRRFPACSRAHCSVRSSVWRATAPVTSRIRFSVRLSAPTSPRAMNMLWFCACSVYQCVGEHRMWALSTAYDLVSTGEHRVLERIRKLPQRLYSRRSTRGNLCGIQNRILGRWEDILGISIPPEYPPTPNVDHTVRISKLWGI